MAESTLSLNREALMLEIGRVAGWGTDSTKWSAEETNAISRILNQALLSFYFNAVLPGTAKLHEWSFLRPTSSLTLWATTTGTVSGLPVYSAVTGLSTITVTAAAFTDSMEGADFTFDTSGISYPIVDCVSTTIVTVTGDAHAEATGDTFTITSDGTFRLPDDFGALDGPLCFDAASGYVDMLVTSERLVQRRKAQSGTTTRRPQYGAIRPAIISGATSTRYELVCDWIPDQDYEVTYRKVILRDALTTAQYPAGGAMHAATILAACRAETDLQLNDRMEVHALRYKELLTSSILRDKQIAGPTHLGRNGPGFRSYVPQMSTRVTIDGVEV